MEVYYFYSDHIYKYDNWESDSIYIRDGKFTKTFNNRNKAKEMNVEPFWIGPGKVYVDIGQRLIDQQLMENAIKVYINRGCTLLLCQFPIESNFKLKQKFNAFKELLSSNLPIDFMIVPRIPSHKITIEQIKFFGSQKVPFILVDAESKKELKSVKWEWIQATQSFSKTPIKYMAPNAQLAKEWTKIMQKYRLETFEEPIDEYPLSKKLLRLTGISPLKGEFLHQACADYNLFDLTTKPAFDEQADFRYHKAIPVITISNGIVVKSHNEIYLNNSKGTYRQVTIPRHFL